MKTIVSILMLLAIGLNAPAQQPPEDVSRRAEQFRAVRGAGDSTNQSAQPTPTIPSNRPRPFGPRSGIQPPAPANPAPTNPVADPNAPASAPNTPPPVVSAAAPAPAPEPILFERSTIDFPAMPADKLVDMYAELVGRTVIRPATLDLSKTTIALKNQTPLTKSELIELLQSVLAINGIQVAEFGNKFLKVVATPQIGMIGIGTNDITSVRATIGGVVNQFVQLKYIRPSAAQPLLVPMASLGMANPVQAIDDNMMLVLRDNVENVKRMMEMIAMLDTAVPSEFESKVIPIKYAKAAEIASALNSLSSGGGGTTVGTPRSTGQRAGPSGTRPGYGNTGAASPFGAQPNQIGNPSTPNTGTPSQGGSFQDRLNRLVSKASSSGDLTIIGQTKIIADERSNSLLVFAMKQDMMMITNIIDKLDVILPQVLIETVIVSVSLDNSWELGISAAQEQKALGNHGTGLGGYNNGNPFYDFMGAASTNAFPGNFTSVLPPGFSYFGKIGQTWDVALKAIAADSRFNVVQRPSVQTSHATPASLFIGETVPYVTGTYYGGGYNGGPGSSYSQLRVGIQLDVTPFINTDGLVLMEINETIDEINGTTKIDNNDVPKTVSRTLSAQVAVKDRDTIMLGGFIRNRNDEAKSGVPLLKDIPILGALFSTRNSQKNRQELLVMMRPTVLRQPDEASAQLYFEKERLPGIRRAEDENRRFEERNNEKEKRRSERERARDDHQSKNTVPDKAVVPEKQYTQAELEAQRKFNAQFSETAPTPPPFTVDELKLFSTQPSTNTSGFPQR